MPSIAIVLGAGGVVGGAYHAGAIAAIAAVTGFDARDAELLVGTSAGSGLSAFLRIGFSPADLLARATDRPLSPEGNDLAAHLPAGRVQVPSRPAMGSWLLPQAPWLAVPSILSRGGVRPGLLAAGLLPRGSVDAGLLGDRIRAISGAGWPDRPTWITAVRLRDGKRVVFGRDDVDVPDLGVAVQASSAVPGFFAPVTIAKHDYIDGGAWSPTNADLVAGLGFDLVVVVSPMSAVKSALGRSVHAVGRTLHARALAGEVGKVRKARTPVVTIQPTARAIAEMGLNPLENAKAPPVARQAYDEVSELLERPALADRVGILTGA